VVTISKFSYENPRFINLLRRRSSIPATQKSFMNYGDIFVVDTVQEAVDAVNEIAPEHVVNATLKLYQIPVKN
jgi:histidinol dehydrogenase